MKRRLLFVCSVLALGLASVRPVSAAPLLNVTVTPLGDGTYKYDWLLDNTDGTEAVFDLGLFYSGPVDDTTVTDPTGWTHVATGYDPSTGQGFIDWFSPVLAAGSTPYDLQVGDSLRGFSLISGLGPGPIQFSINGDLNNLSATTGPSVTAVPEPASLLLLGTGLTALVARRQRGRKVS